MNPHSAGENRISMKKYRETIYIIILAGLLSGFLASIKIVADTREKGLSTWLGKYSFDECCGGDDDNPFMMMHHELEIYKKGSTYYGRIEVVGQTTWIVAKAVICGDAEQIDVVFLENLMNELGFITDYKFEDVFLSLKRMDGKIYTYWGEMSPLLLENEVPGVYLEKYFNGFILQKIIVKIP